MLPTNTTEAEAAQHLGPVNNLSDLDYRQLHWSPQRLYKPKQFLVKEGVKPGRDGLAQSISRSNQQCPRRQPHFIAAAVSNQRHFCNPNWKFFSTDC